MLVLRAFRFQALDLRSELHLDLSHCNARGFNLLHFGAMDSFLLVYVILETLNLH